MKLIMGSGICAYLLIASVGASADGHALLSFGLGALANTIAFACGRMSTTTP